MNNRYNRAAVIVGLLILAGCARSVQPTGFSASDEALYQARFLKQQQAAITGGGIGNYEPLEEFGGAGNPVHLPTTPTPSISDTALSKAVEYVRPRNTSALIVWRDGVIEKEAYFGDFDRDTLINAKSLAKPLASIAIGRAIALGYIDSLDQPAADFIKEWADDSQRKKITLRHLLGMRGGLLPQALSRLGPEHVLNRAYLHPRHDEVIINEYPVTNEPGTRYEYANASAELIAPIIERATGQRYLPFLTETLLRPLGAAGGTGWVNRIGGTAHAGCCIQLTAQTWLRLAILLIGDGVWEGTRLLPKDYVQQMQQTSAQNPHAGLGVWVAGDYVEWRGSLHPSIDLGRTYHSEPYLAQDLFLFDGNGNQVVYILPTQGIIILRTGGFTSPEYPWDNSFLPNLILRNLIN